MILAPTYHVFRMYKKHQGAELLDSYIADVCQIGTGEHKVPNLQESVSVAGDGTITVTIANLSVTDSYPVDIAFAQKKAVSAKATILSGKMDAHNTFDEPENVKEEVFTNVSITDDGVSLVIPACSVISMEIA